VPGRGNGSCPGHRAWLVRIPWRRRRRGRRGEEGERIGRPLHRLVRHLTLGHGCRIPRRTARRGDLSPRYRPGRRRHAYRQAVGLPVLAAGRGWRWPRCPPGRSRRRRMRCGSTLFRGCSRMPRPGRQRPGWGAEQGPGLRGGKSGAFGPPPPDPDTDQAREQQNNQRPGGHGRVARYGPRPAQDARRGVTFRRPDLPRRRLRLSRRSGWRRGRRAGGSDERRGLNGLQCVHRPCAVARRRGGPRPGRAAGQERLPNLAAGQAGIPRPDQGRDARDDGAGGVGGAHVPVSGGRARRGEVHAGCGERHVRLPDGERGPDEVAVHGAERDDARVGRREGGLVAVLAVVSCGGDEHGSLPEGVVHRRTLGRAAPGGGAEATGRGAVGSQARRV
jgi:hypothetical protein